jgi:hypothetical protein
MRAFAALGRTKSREYSGLVSDTEKVPDETSAKEVAPSLTSATAIKTHLTLVVGLALCAVAFWFELSRAEGGNELSWAYVFEWPLLGLFAIYMWWKLLHPGFTIRRPREKPGIAPEFQTMLEAWEGEVRKLEIDRGVEEPGSPHPSDAEVRDDE